MEAYENRDPNWSQDQQQALVMTGATRDLKLPIVFAEIQSDKVLGMVSVLEVWQHITNIL